ncbi:MAG: DUF1501 domain-containing protein, partial [Planctomycetaceae bacterium]
MGIAGSGLDAATLQVGIASRRMFLGASLAGLMGTTTSLPAAEPAKNTSCIVFFLDGGFSHHETFDPKPKAAAQVRGDFGVTDTTVPGLTICDRLPLLAGRARDYSVIRSLHHGNPSHAPAEHQILTGWMGSRSGTARAFIETPSLGSIVSRLGGPAMSGMPSYVAVPWSFHHAYGGSPFGGAAYLGANYEPLESGPPPKSTTAAFSVPSLTLGEGVTKNRLGGRRQLLGQLDSRQQGRRARRARAFTSEALDLLGDERVRKVFDLSREPRAVRDRYGGHEWGQGALLARRLVENGVKFVMLQCGLRQDWDTHDNNFKRLGDSLLPPLDRAAAALIGDLVDRGLHQQTLVMVIGEFGWTPVVNGKAGRDHWARVFSADRPGGEERRDTACHRSDQAPRPANRG